MSHFFQLLGGSAADVGPAQGAEFGGKATELFDRDDEASSNALVSVIGGKRTSRSGTE